MGPKRNIYRAYSSRLNPAIAGSGRAIPYHKKNFLRNGPAVVLTVLVVAGLIFAGQRLIGKPANVVPENIQKSAGFTVYFPDAAKLPAGFALDTGSFRLAQKGVVVFALTDSNKRSLVFSEQQQPSSDEINKFVSSYIPVNSTLQLGIGQARIGAYGNAPDIRSTVSLPIHGGPWLIMTAPSQISHDDIVKVLRSLTR